jgi:vitamin B12 transporter
MSRAFAIVIFLVAAAAHAQEAADAGTPEVPRREATESIEVSGPRVRATSAQRLQHSADAVNVVEVKEAHEQAVDLGEVLARTQGVGVRRDGGLGGNASFSIDGLQDDQIRFFLDGVPLQLAGFPFGVANVPVNLIERVEVYRGVVPVRFGADALGGAVNLVSDRSYTTHADASWQAGSFGTYRGTLDGRWLGPEGLLLRASAFADLARNDYDVDVQVTDAQGQLSPATVPRFHDGYRALGGNLEAGFVDQPWARRLVLQVFASAFDKQLQNNLVMTVPYGEPTYGQTAYGATLRYEAALSDALELELLSNYAHRRIDFTDAGQWVYDWFGNRGLRRTVPGEIDGAPTDQTVREDASFNRAALSWALAPAQTLRLSLSPVFTTRRGEDRLALGTDPLAARRGLFTFVSGVEYAVEEGALANVAFVKDYLYQASTDALLPDRTPRPELARHHSLGAGDSLRYRVTPRLELKASYEYATRLPRPDEVFGDGVLVQPDLGLEPEVSHNFNLGPRLELRRTGQGDFTVDLNGFFRHSDRLIVLLGDEKLLSYQNVYAARGLGLESGASWSPPLRWLSLNAQVTWQDVRNASGNGTFGAFDGDRIPNRPWLFGSWGAQLRLPFGADSLQPFYAGRWVHSFLRGWESAGQQAYQQSVDAQVSHAAGLTYVLAREGRKLTATLEVDNLLDARLFDDYGVQRPGRSFSLKLTGDLR